jgi:hypothetical protein
MKAKIGRELGISGAAVAKLAKRGMPLDSADAARRWRTANLNPLKAKADPGPSPETLVQRAEKLAELAAAALGSHAFDAIAAELRAALRAVPGPYRMRVRMGFDVTEALIGAHALSVLNEAPRQPADVPMSDDDAESIGQICYALACGEMIAT